MCLRCLAAETDPAQRETWADRWPLLHLGALLACLALACAGAWAAAVLIETALKGG